MKDYRQIAWRELLLEMRSPEPRDEAAWNEAHQRLLVNARYNLRSLQRVSPEAAADVVDRVLAKLHADPTILCNLANSREELKPRRYLAARVRHAAIDFARQYARQHPPGQVSAGGEVVGWGQPSAADVFEHQESAAELRQMLQDVLKPDEWKLLQMKFWDDRSLADIAVALGISYHATAVRLQRLQRRLRTILGKSWER